MGWVVREVGGGGERAVSEVEEAVRLGGLGLGFRV